MHKIELSYLLSPQRGKDALIRNPMMDMLHAVSEHGSIAKAARALGLSYRHAWGSLKDWEKTLGRSLIVWDKGQRARLTEFGDKLLWAERQAQARLAPQISLAKQRKVSCRRATPASPTKHSQPSSQTSASSCSSQSAQDRNPQKMSSRSGR